MIWWEFRLVRHQSSKTVYPIYTLVAKWCTKKLVIKFRFWDNDNKRLGNSQAYDRLIKLIKAL